MLTSWISVVDCGDQMITHHSCFYGNQGTMYFLARCLKQYQNCTRMPSSIFQNLRFARVTLLLRKGCEVTHLNAAAGVGGMSLKIIGTSCCHGRMSMKSRSRSLTKCSRAVPRPSIG